MDQMSGTEEGVKKVWTPPKFSACITKMVVQLIIIGKSEGGATLGGNLGVQLKIILGSLIIILTVNRKTSIKCL